MSEVIPAPNTPLVSFIERAARDESFDVGKFEALLRMQKEVEHDQARKAFNRAMAAAQAEMLPIIRDAKNTHLNNKYAKLETIDAAIRPIYTAHGFSVRYGSAPSPHEGVMRITCTVAHDSGYFEENYLDAPVTTTGSQGGKMAITPVQAIGSTVTYLRRYLLGMVWNAVLADADDDDGEASRRTPPARQETRPPAWEARSTIGAEDQVRLNGWQAAFDAAKTTPMVMAVEKSKAYQLGVTHAPEPVVERLRAMAEQAYERVLPPPATAPIGNAPEHSAPDTASDELPEIVGQEKMAAG